MTVSLVIAAGGTGGHLLPAFAVAAAVARASPGARISFIGARRGLERDLVPAAGYRLDTTSVRPFARGARAGITAWSMLPATVQARGHLRRAHAQAVLGMGGYPSVPAMLAARTLGLPSLIHEQNAVPGMANELAARVTPNIAVSFPQTVGAFRRPARLVGVPVREAIASIDRAARRDEALASFRLAPDRRTVLVFGGSLGASAINRAVAGLAARWAGRDDVQMLVASGRVHADRVREEIPDGKLVVRVEPFIERMELAYAAADVAVCRAGASTVYELAAAGLPSVLVPYPHARRREQDENARLLAEAGAAEVIADGALTGDVLDARLGALLGDTPALARMGAAARSVARPEAAADLAAWLLDIAGARRG